MKTLNTITFGLLASCLSLSCGMQNSKNNAGEGEVKALYGNEALSGIRCFDYVNSTTDAIKYGIYLAKKSDSLNNSDLTKHQYSLTIKTAVLPYAGVDLSETLSCDHPLEFPVVTNGYAGKEVSSVRCQGEKGGFFSLTSNAKFDSVTQVSKDGLTLVTTTKLVSAPTEYYVTLGGKVKSAGAQVEKSHAILAGNATEVGSSFVLMHTFKNVLTTDAEKSTMMQGTCGYYGYPY